MAVCLALIASFSRALAQHPETITVSGLKASVDVLRDTWGINHIYAGNQRDLFFAQGYCAARDCLFQFEIWRRQANGTVAEILGHRGGRNSYTVNSTGPSDNQPIGASFRMIADLSDWDLTVMTNTPGQSGDPKSRYYSNLFEKWAKDQYFPAYFSSEKIRANTTERQILVPAGE